MRRQVELSYILFCSLHFLLPPAMLLSKLEAPSDISQQGSMMVSITKNGTGELFMVLKFQHVTLTYAVVSQQPRKSFSIFHKTANGRKNKSAVQRKIKKKTWFWLVLTLLLGLNSWGCECNSCKKKIVRERPGGIFIIN